jgi:hypothetical protein
MNDLIKLQKMSFVLNIISNTANFTGKEKMMKKFSNKLVVHQKHSCRTLDQNPKLECSNAANFTKREKNYEKSFCQVGFALVALH